MHLIYYDAIFVYLILNQFDNMQDYRKLDTWRKAHKFALEIYEIVNEFPKIEIYSLTDQLKRASVSMPANIAEGCGRQTPKELLRYLYIAFGSACEVEYYLLLAKDLDYISETDFQRLAHGIEEIKKMISGLMSKVEEDIEKFSYK